MVDGRAAGAAMPPEVLIQTRYAQHPLYAAVVRHDYDRYAGSLLEERRQAALPPYMYQALLRAEAPELATAIAFLEQARDILPTDTITLNDPIPMTMTRVYNVDRAQLLVEAEVDVIVVDQQPQTVFKSAQEADDRH